MSKDTLHLMLDEATILARIDAMAQEIDAFYNGEPLVVICVLKGGFMFFTDLVRRLRCGPELDFIGLSSYGYGDSSGGTITLTKDVSMPLEGKHVLVVEDIIDTGHSMRHLLEHLHARRARSVRLATLLDKHERREVPVPVDFTGFSVNDGFIVGYGLDYAERYRELPALYTVETRAATE